MLYHSTISLNDDRILEVRGVIETALKSQYGAGVHRHKLRDARDVLHSLCREMEENLDAEEHEGVYLRIFDALSFLTEATRSLGVKPELLRRAIARLS